MKGELAIVAAILATLALGSPLPPEYSGALGCGLMFAWIFSAAFDFRDRN